MSRETLFCSVNLLWCDAPLVRIELTLMTSFIADSDRAAEKRPRHAADDGGEGEQSCCDDQDQQHGTDSLAGAPLLHAGSPTFNMSLPGFLPVKTDIRRAGAFSKPTCTSSSTRSLPCCTHSASCFAPWSSRSAKENR